MTTAARWPASSLPANNHAFRPMALGRKNWLFVGSLRAGQRAAAIMSLIQSARLNGHDGVLSRNRRFFRRARKASTGVG
jgi:hypothetical protein